MINTQTEAEKNHVVMLVELTSGDLLAALDGSLLLTTLNSDTPATVRRIAESTARALGITVLEITDHPVPLSPGWSSADVLEGLSSVKRFNHAYTLGFSIVSQSPDGNGVKAEELLAGLQSRIRYLSLKPDELIESCGMPFDTYEM